MVERLKQAIEKARAQRDDPAAAARSHAPAQGRRQKASAPAVDAAWAALPEITLDMARLSESRIVTHDKAHSAHVPFDLLRTRLLKVFRDNKWRSIAITSPTKSCGKTVVAANLAFSLARQPDIRTVLMDMDLKMPGLAKTLRWREAPRLEWFLNGRSAMDAALSRVGENLALGLNAERVRDSTELLQDDGAGVALATIAAQLQPDVIIYDLPPMQVSDDALAFMPRTDCVLLVAAAGQTTAQQIEECERQFTGQTNFLGVLLNKAERAGSADYYEYA